MRFIRDNRYYYQVWVKGKELPTIRRMIFVAFYWTWLTIIYPFHGKNYLKKIERWGGICQLDNNKYDDIALYVPLYKEDFIQKMIVRSADFFEVDILNILRSDYIREGFIFLDIGANIGNHTVFFSKVCKAEKVYSYEPVLSTFKILKKNVKINRLSDIVSTFNFALGESAGRASINQYKTSNIGGTSIRASENGEIEVYSLDELEFNEDVIDFVKIDVEGFEYHVLNGGIGFLKRYKPLLFIEIATENFDDTNRLLLDTGYCMKRRFPADNYLYSTD